MDILVLTIFPELFDSFVSTSLITKAIENKKLSIKLINIRDFAEPPHYKVDDSPYGGGPGMVLKPEPLFLAIKEAKNQLPDAKVVFLTPAGMPYKQSIAKEYSQTKGLILVCGRYEGVDQRVLDLLVDQELSIGDYVLMGGEVPAMVVIESVARLVEQVVGNQESVQQESFTSDDGKCLLEGPQYTRPAEFMQLKVPEVLLSGNHKEISAWRKQKAIEKTNRVRPEL